MARPHPTFELVTMGHIRGHGCPALLVYCVSPWCNHSARLNLDWLPDDTVLLDLDHRMVCTACGLIGADVWEPAEDIADARGHPWPYQGGGRRERG
jgi:hypothetical protein